jgi:hypothetical protein
MYIRIGDIVGPAVTDIKFYPAKNNKPVFCLTDWEERDRERERARGTSVQGEKADFVLR